MHSITFDIDWAPEWAVADCADICRKAGVKATFFATHPDDILKDLLASKSFEVGIHPNFLPNSSQGKATEEVIEYILSIVPHAKSMRTHALVQSSQILANIVKNTEIETDVSLLLPFHKNLAPTRLYFESGGRPLIRLPYYWEDDVSANWPGWSWSSPIEHDQDGLRIYDFHPIHVALNMSTMQDYDRLKSGLNGRPLTSLTRAECKTFVRQGEGTRTYIERLVSSVAENRFQTISEITKAYLEA
ncbi:polysaccharide deacetylase WbmS family protein [Pseudomonas fluorescens]|uniref:polysaccharide deacetylase WbmS family protein n=1 Tax=Pseudomonas fluorescens TaxID=294 RepID=UPI001240D760|nr:hypothetical protein [Pseudomonas fluorescens]VVN23560.1 hypothetical protein PS676_04435 [Pseudomonas fluorescens]